MLFNVIPRIFIGGGGGGGGSYLFAAVQLAYSTAPADRMDNSIDQTIQYELRVTQNSSYIMWASVYIIS